MPSGARILRERLLVGFGKRVHAVLGQIPARRRDAGRDDDQRRPQRGERDRFLRRAGAPARRAAARSAANARPGRHQRERDQHHVEPDQAVLKLRDHRRRRVTGGALPDAALHGGDEVEDPGADRHAERQDRRGRRMLGHRRRRGRERDRQAGVQQVAERDRRQFRRVDAAAVAFPQHDAATNGASDATSQPPSSTIALAATRAIGRHRVLHLDLQRAALPIAGRPAGSRRTAAGTPPPPRRR